jgi:hypothetical protein
MADNAPYSAQRPPYPNVVNKFRGRVEQHVLTFTGANGTSVILSTQSTEGVTVTYVSEGVYDFTFPAGGTGAIGWVLVTPPVTAANTVADTRMYALDSDLLNFATGAGRLTAVDGSATPIVSDIIGTVTLVISVVKATA